MHAQFSLENVEYRDNITKLEKASDTLLAVHASPTSEASPDIVVAGD